MVTNPLAMRRHRFKAWVRKIPSGRAWQPTPVFLSRKFHRQRSLMGYSPWGSQRVRHTPHVSMGSQRVGHNRATEHTRLQVMKNARRRVITTKL